MILDLPPSCRLDLVRYRADAMRIGCHEVIPNLTSPNDDPSSRLAKSILAAELLHLDFQDRKAQEIYDRDVQPFLYDLSPEKASLLLDNGTVLAHAQLLTGSNNFYHLVDQRRILGIQLSDEKSAARLHIAHKSGKQRDALVASWQQLLRAYNSMCWRRIQHAEQDLAHECLTLNWPHESMYHTVCACNTSIIDNIVKCLISTNSSEVIRKTIGRVLDVSALKRHAVVVAELLIRIADVIPEHCMNEVVNWLKDRAAFVPKTMPASALLKSVWNAVAAVANRLSAEDALAFAQIAILHSSFLNPTIDRRYIIDAINKCVGRIFPSEIPRLTAATLPLILNTKFDHDYVNAINLLCHLAERGDENVRESVRERLYPPGEPISDTVLIQVAQHFGANIKTQEALNRGAIVAAKHLRLQVQHLGPGEEPAQIGGFGTVFNTINGNRCVAHLSGAQHELDALVAHAAEISEQSITELGSAIIEMFANSENLVSNRIALIASFRKLLRYISPDLMRIAVKELLPLSYGTIAESRLSMSFAEASNPLNPFKAATGNPQDLQGISLLALADIANADPSGVPDFHNDLLLLSLTNNHPRIRQLGCRAARLSQVLTHEEQMAVLFCIGDMEHETVTEALLVFENLERFNLDCSSGALLIIGIERVLRTSSPLARSQAAFIVKKLLESNWLNDNQVTRLLEIRVQVMGDISYSVRQVFH